MQQPRYLPLMIRMIQQCRPNLSIPPHNPHNKLLPRLHLLDPQHADLICRLDAIVRRGIGKRKRQHPLLLQIRLVDAREAFCNDGHAAQVARLQRRVFAARAFAVVGVADDAPSQPRVAVGFGNLRDWGDVVVEDVRGCASGG